MHGFRPHKGLKKRVTITRNGQVKHNRVGSQHRKNRHTAKQNLQLRQRKIAPECERKRIQGMLGFKIRRPDAQAQAQAAATDQNAND